MEPAMLNFPGLQLTILTLVWFSDFIVVCNQAEIIHSAFVTDRMVGNRPSSPIFLVLAVVERLG